MNVKMQVIIRILLVNIATVSGLTCEELLELPQEKELSKQNLHLGKVELSRQEVEFLWKSIIKFHEPS